MSYNENLVNKVREALANLSKPIEEKTMFQGLTFMVDGKMCIGIRDSEIMCRTNPKTHTTLAERNGCRPMIHGKRIMRGFFFVNEEGYRRQEDFNFWINQALEYNSVAKPSKKKI